MEECEIIIKWLMHFFHSDLQCALDITHEIPGRPRRGNISLFFSFLLGPFQKKLGNTCLNTQNTSARVSVSQGQAWRAQRGLFCTCFPCTRVSKDRSPNTHAWQQTPASVIHLLTGARVQPDVLVHRWSGSAPASDGSPGSRATCWWVSCSFFFFLKAKVSFI